MDMDARTVEKQLDVEMEKYEYPLPAQSPVPAKHAHCVMVRAQMLVLSCRIIVGGHR